MIDSMSDLTREDSGVVLKAFSPLTCREDTLDAYFSGLDSFKMICVEVTPRMH